MIFEDSVVLQLTNTVHLNNYYSTSEHLEQ